MDENFCSNKLSGGLTNTQNLHSETEAIKISVNSYTLGQFHIHFTPTRIAARKLLYNANS